MPGYAVSASKKRRQHNQAPMFVTNSQFHKKPDYAGKYLTSLAAAKRRFLTEFADKLRDFSATAAVILISQSKNRSLLKPLFLHMKGLKIFRLSIFAALLMISCLSHVSARDGKTGLQENSEDQTFRVRTELVEIRTVVTDRNGRIVEDLRKDDFELLENDLPQEISFFSISKVEGELATPSVLELTPGRTFSAPARCTILYVDNLHLEFRDLEWVKQNLRRFIDEKMTDQDMAAIVASEGKPGIGRQFTRDRRILHYAVDSIQPGPATWETPFSAVLAGRILRGDRLALEEGKAAIQAVEGIEDNRQGSWTIARARQIVDGASRFRESMLSTLRDLIEQLASCRANA